MQPPIRAPSLARDVHAEWMVDWTGHSVGWGEHVLPSCTVEEMDGEAEDNVLRFLCIRTSFTTSWPRTTTRLNEVKI